MKSPWKQLQPLEPGREYFVFASSLPLRRYRWTGQLFRGAKAVREQLDATSGLVGFSLLARPGRKQYATLSVWDGEDALRAFAEAEPHRQLMADLSTVMGATKFVHWRISGSEGRPSWREALRRLS